MAQAKKKVAVVVEKKRAPRAKKTPLVKITLPKEKEITTKEMLGKGHALLLSRPRVGQFRKVSSLKVTSDADPDALRVRKRLFDSDTYREINKVRTEARVYVADHSLPLILLKKGAYLIPKANEKMVEEKLAELSVQFRTLVGKFADEWDALVVKSKKPLGSLYNPSDYYTKEEVQRRFAITWSWIRFDVPIDLDEELFKKEQAKHEKTWQEARDVWMGLLRAQFAEVVDHLVERLTPSKDGKKKIFRDSALTNINEWTAAFDPRNIPDDVQLKVLVDQAKKLVKGADPNVLREDEHAREQVRAAFTTIKNTLTTMVIDKPSREVSFDDDDM
jgi:hypothetical protein